MIMLLFKIVFMFLPTIVGLIAFIVLRAVWRLGRDSIDHRRRGRSTWSAHKREALDRLKMLANQDQDGPFFSDHHNVHMEANQAMVTEECGVRSCGAKNCDRVLLDGEIFCDFCNAYLAPKLRDALAVARAEQRRGDHASLVRLAREILDGRPRAEDRNSLIQQHGRRRRA